MNTLHCVCEMKSTDTSCLHPFTQPAVLGVELPLKTQSGIYHMDNIFVHIYMHPHVFGSEANLSQPHSIWETTVIQSLSLSIYKCNRQSRFYFHFMSKPIWFLCLSNEVNQKIKLHAGKAILHVTNRCENKASSGRMSQQGNTVQQLQIRPFKG